VTLLLASKAAVNAVSLSGQTPLDRAKEEEVKALLREHFGKHSLVQAVESCMLEEDLARIKEGWDVNQQNTRGKTPLDIAQSEEVKALLREHGGKHSLFHVVESCMLEEVSALIRAGADVNQHNAEGETTPPTKGAASLGAAEMGQATRRELALGLRSAEASLAATRGRSRGWRGGAGARETQRRRLPSRSALPWICSRDWAPRVTASMLRRSLPFQPTLLANSPRPRPPLLPPPSTRTPSPIATTL